MKIALITGSCGLVGSESSFFFSNKGFKILGIDNNSRKKFFGKEGDITRVKNSLKKEIRNYSHFNIDIRNLSKLKKIFKKYKFINSEQLAKECFSIPIDPTLKKNEITKIVKVLNLF